MRKLKQKFAVQVGAGVPQLFRAWDHSHLIENLPKRCANWSVIEYRDADGYRVVLRRDFLEEHNMSLSEIVEDWLAHAEPGELSEEILAHDLTKPFGQSAVEF